MGKETKSGLRTAFLFICAAFATVIIAVSVISVSGCSPETRHDVLTFFFTGVPELGSELHDSDNTVQVKARKKKHRKLLLEPKFYIHGPYAARECEKCHSRKSATQFQFGRAKADDVNIKKSIGPRLIYPLEKLCVTCHVEKSDAFARSLDLTTHEPVATGMCVDCHNPHKAARQYMLLGKSSVELCSIACHEDDGFQQRGAHRKAQGKDCLECHNPHVGKTTKLLRADFDEWQQFDGVN